MQRFRTAGLLRVVPCARCRVTIHQVARAVLDHSPIWFSSGLEPGSLLTDQGFPIEETSLKERGKPIASGEKNILTAKGLLGDTWDWSR